MKIKNIYINFFLGGSGRGGGGGGVGLGGSGCMEMEK